jgi:hypothetical protein
MSHYFPLEELWIRGSPACWERPPHLLRWPAPRRRPCSRQGLHRLRVTGICLIQFRMRCRCSKPTMRGLRSRRPKLPRSQSELGIIIITTIMFGSSRGIVTITIIIITTITIRIGGIGAPLSGAPIYFCEFSRVAVPRGISLFFTVPGFRRTKKMAISAIELGVSVRQPRCILRKHGPAGMNAPSAHFAFG